jgi:chromate transporter
VLLAFLRGDLVERLGWLTDAQFIDAVAVGQVTPGPLFTAATFVGFVLAGDPGRNRGHDRDLPPGIRRRRSPRSVGRTDSRPAAHRALLDGVSAAAIGLMAAVSIQLGAFAFVDPLTVVIGAASAIAMVVGRLPLVLLVLAGATAGLAATSAGIGP